MLTGHVDEVRRHRVIGWAADTDQPDARIEVSILLNGRECGHVVADKPREGLKAQGSYGDGLHGFEFFFDEPLSILRSYEVVVRFRANGELLPRGRTRLEHLRDEQRGLRPLLVTATGRSGTTMLMHRLGNARDIVIGEAYPYEMKLLTYYARALEVLTSPGNREKSVTPDNLFENPYFLGLNPFHHPLFQPMFPRPGMLYDFFERHASQKIRAAFSEIVADFYHDMRCYQKKLGAHFFAEKADVFTTARSFTRLAFRGVKEIVLVRDLRDVHCSRKSFWSDTPQASFQNLRSVQVALLQIQQENPDDALFLRYEDLIQQAEPTMARIASFLGLDEPIRLKPETEQQVFSGHGTSEDPAASIGRWRHDMSAEERSAFATEFRPFLRAFGYEAEAG
jgi:hypothetical protein